MVSKYSCANVPTVMRWNGAKWKLELDLGSEQCLYAWGGEWQE